MRENPAHLVVAAPSDLPKNPIATIDVNPFRLGIKIPRSFLGLSIEYPDVQKFVGTTKNPQPSFVRLLNQLRQLNGPPIIRVGGESQDESWYSNTKTARPNNVSFTIDRDLVQSLNAAAQATQSKLILGLNLGADDPSILLNWVETSLNDFLAEQLLAFELGNEPDNYTRHLVNGTPLRKKSWSYDAYAKQFDHYKEMLTPHLKGRKLLAAPAFTKGFMAEAPNFIERESVAITIATLHYSALDGCGEKKSNSDALIKSLLSPTTRDEFQKEFEPVMSIANRLNVASRLDEVNVIDCDTHPEVSNSFAAALWGLELMFDFAQAGGVGVNFTATPNSAPFLMSESQEPRVLPLYYGMMLFAQATQQSASFIPLKIDSLANIRAWSTIDKRGTIRLVLLNKDSEKSGVVSVHVPKTTGSIKIVRLTAPSLTSQTDVRLGDIEETLTATNSTFPVSLPAGSAAMVSVLFNPR